MSSKDVVGYLVERQAAEGIPGHVMASRIGTTETNWSHARNGRRGLTVKQIERAIAFYPELSERFATPSPEQVPA